MPELAPVGTGQITSLTTIQPINHRTKPATAPRRTRDVRRSDEDQRREFERGLRADGEGTGILSALVPVVLEEPVDEAPDRIHEPERESFQAPFESRLFDRDIVVVVVVDRDEASAPHAILVSMLHAWRH